MSLRYFTDIGQNEGSYESLNLRSLPFPVV